MRDLLYRYLNWKNQKLIFHLDLKETIEQTNELNEVDEDGSGTLDFDEFQEMMMG